MHLHWPNVKLHYSLQCSQSYTCTYKRECPGKGHTQLIVEHKHIGNTLVPILELFIMKYPSRSPTFAIIFDQIQQELMSGHKVTQSNVNNRVM